MTDEERQELAETVRTLLNRMPQPEPEYRLSAFIGLAVEQSGLDWPAAVRALIGYIRLVENAPAASLNLRRDKNPLRELADALAAEYDRTNPKPEPTKH